ncbi:hypothetical protein OG767_08320 [Micromonospora sp. NBC_01392]
MSIVVLDTDVASAILRGRSTNGCKDYADFAEHDRLRLLDLA